jgi:F0F1-type ATP synthase membrane subunit b/b'
MDYRRKQVVMSTGTTIAIVVVVVVVIVIVILAITLGRRSKVNADRRRATNLREQAAQDELGAREHEAAAARADADAKQAEVDAERLRREAADRAAEAGDVRAKSDEQLRRADELDPDVRTDRRATVAEEPTVTPSAAPETASGVPVAEPAHRADTDLT